MSVQIRDHAGFHENRRRPAQMKGLTAMMCEMAIPP